MLSCTQLPTAATLEGGGEAMTGEDGVLQRLPCHCATMRLLLFG